METEATKTTGKRTAKKTAKTGLIVAYGSGATLAAQVEGIEKVLIKPYYSTSNMLAGILGEKGQKQRIELPTLGQPEYLTVIRPMVWEWQ